MAAEAHGARGPGTRGIWAARWEWDCCSGVTCHGADESAPLSRCSVGVAGLMISLERREELRIDISRPLEKEQGKTAEMFMLLSSGTYLPNF